jgi:hypothetical protein
MISILQAMKSERRVVTDRRTSATKPFSFYTFRGRRRKSRRHDERQNYYVDRYNVRYLILVVAILILCFLDAYLTLLLLQVGAIELNPFMLYFIKKDVVLSMVVKYIMTAAALIIFLVHKNFRVFGGLRVRNLIYAILAVYSGLVLFEAVSCFKVMGIDFFLSIF